ncbi:flagellar M-ring protein FliF [Psychrosphaera ytuae]|uniref:Flagellar M-ring protein n=1 Tax=Psychrosphaera ytuae TaxID=2820710 RepID=A0A975HJN4_9GAMM|nr:flagellar basal-body MS-ring/collar protein FliF [Psychrosphaera ytuae]QTH65413.1 flagellar M-ring protein FliF [Psychrosphaera ytuae]
MVSLNNDADNVEEQKSGFLNAVSSAEVLRQGALILALVICIAITIIIFLWSREPEMRPLGQFETEQLIETLDYLDAQKIEYVLEQNVIKVPADRYQDIKLSLARGGLSQAPTEGSEILLQDTGFGVSQRMETERLKHSREQQLARTIEELNTVSRARVLLAIPKQNIFARHTKEPSATVVVTLKRGRMLTAEETDSIVDIVASAVQGLSPTRVTVTDQNGRLLNSGSQNSLSALSRKQFEIEQKREDEYLQKINAILSPVIGMENYTAQVDVTMDFTQVQETQKTYNPDLPAIRSEMLIEENQTGSGPVGIPGALSNQPPLESDIPEDAANARTRGATGRSSKEQTRNYELDQTISHKQNQTGVVRRLSVSVAVDYIRTVGEDGTMQQVPRSQQALVNLRRLLQGGIGFDMTRGDTLEVVTIPFNKQDEFAATEVPIYEQEWFQPMVKTLAAMIVIIVLIIFLVRPLLNKLLSPEDTTDEYEEDALGGVDLGDEALDMLNTEFDEKDIGFSADGTLQLPDLHGDEDLLKAVRALVANEPELSSQVVKGWLLEDE